MENKRRPKKKTEDLSLKHILSNNMKRLRSGMGMSQMDLADAAGLAPNYISDIENERKWPSDVTILKLLKALKTEPYQLFVSQNQLEIKGADIFMEDISASLALTVKERFNHYTMNNQKYRNNDS